MGAEHRLRCYSSGTSLAVAPDVQLPATPEWKMATMSPLLSCTQVERYLMQLVPEGDQHLSAGWGLLCSLRNSIPELQPTQQFNFPLAAGSGGWL